MSITLGERRQDMDAALKASVVPDLRDLGFKGSYPDFRRVAGTRLDLLSFGFNRYGGEFLIELGQGTAGAFRAPWGEIVSDSKARISHLGAAHRGWLGPQGIGVDSLFDFRYGRFADVVGQVRLRLPEAMMWFEKA